MNRFYKECHCDGGYVVEDGVECECGECEGKGFIATEEGSELLKFLEKMRII